MNDTREVRLICSCELCKDIENRFAFKPFSNWVPESGWRMAIIPKHSEFNEEVKATIFALFQVPDKWECIDYSHNPNQAWTYVTGKIPGPFEGFSYFCKFADIENQFQCGELWVLDEGDYYYCRMGFFKPLLSTEMDQYNLVDFTSLGEGNDITSLRSYFRGTFAELA